MISPELAGDGGGRVHVQTQKPLVTTDALESAGTVDMFVEVRRSPKSRRAEGGAAEAVVFDRNGQNSCTSLLRCPPAGRSDRRPGVRYARTVGCAVRQGQRLAERRTKGLPPVRDRPPHALDDSLKYPPYGGGSSSPLAPHRSPYPRPFRPRWPDGSRRRCDPSRPRSSPHRPCTRRSSFAHPGDRAQRYTREPLSHAVDRKRVLPAGGWIGLTGRPPRVCYRTPKVGGRSNFRCAIQRVNPSKSGNSIFLCIPYLNSVSSMRCFAQALILI